MVQWERFEEFLNWQDAEVGRMPVCRTRKNAGVAQLAERHLPKVMVESSTLFARFYLAGPVGFSEPASDYPVSPLQTPVCGGGDPRQGRAFCARVHIVAPFVRPGSFP